MDYEDAWKDAIEQRQTDLHRFHRRQCTNCRYNEQSVFPVPSVETGIFEAGEVSLYTDTVPSRKLSASESKEQGERNLKWQSTLMGKNLTLPTYVVFRTLAPIGVRKRRSEGNRRGPGKRRDPRRARLRSYPPRAQAKLTAQAKQPTE